MLLPLGGALVAPMFFPSFSFIAGSLSVYVTINLSLFLFFLALCREHSLNIIKINALHIPHILLTSLIIILSFASWARIFDVRYIFAHIQILVLIVIFSSLLTRFTLAQVFKALFYGGILLALFDLLAAVDLITGTPKTDMLGIGYAGIGPFMTFANHGGGMALGIVGGVHLYSQVKTNKDKVFIVSMISLMCLMVMLSQSRSSWIAVTVALCIATLYHGTLSALSKNMTRKFFAHAVSALCLLPAIFIALNVFSNYRLLTANVRLSHYNTALQTIAETPFGLGWTGWAKYQTSGHLHNMVLNYGVELGWLGLFAICCLITWGFALFIIGEILFLKPRKSLYCAFAIFIAGLIESMFAPQTPSDWINIGIILLVTSILYETKKQHAHEHSLEVK